MPFASAYLSVSAASVADYLQELNLVTILVRFALATVCAGVLGFERQRKSRPAGLRTHIIVCLGATLVMMISQFLVTRGMSTDVARLGAQVISGIGFLGAGTIILTGRSGKPQVKGLTTAASLWTTACMGLAIGCGFYIGAIGTCLFVLFAVTALNRIDKYLFRRSPALLLQLDLEAPSVLSELTALFEEEEVEVRDLHVSRRTEQGAAFTVATFDLRLKHPAVKNSLLVKLANIGGVCAVEEM